VTTELQVTPELFREWRSPRVGRANPERMNNPVWEWMIRTTSSAYAASQHFGLPLEETVDPRWSFDRFGQTSTELSDGRTVLIAGEHEDSYDPDFYIYNDVVVRHPDGGIDIFGYPTDVFPSTDFHSATVVGNRIIIIGRLGYMAERRPGTTPVEVLDLDTMSMTPVGTTGAPPGWIHRHEASLSEDGTGIIVRRGKIVRGDGHAQQLVENPDDWRLDLSMWEWTRLTERPWTQWRVSRMDGRPNHLWQARSAWMLSGGRWAKEHRESMEAMIRGQIEQLTSDYGVAPDLSLFGNLYKPPVNHESIADVADEHGVHRIVVDGVGVRYIEAPHAVQIIVEGDLPASVVTSITSDLRDKLATLENTEYVVATIQ
jgi:hypothetical protein